MTGKTLHSESQRALINWLRANRQARKVTMRTVAGRLGVSHSWIAKTENGERRLDLNEFVDLCFALGVDPHQGLDLVITSKSTYNRPHYAAMKAAEQPSGLNPKRR
jgi:transcriptional regulator with XRE-family HTH domain